MLHRKIRKVNDYECGIWGKKFLFHATFKNHHRIHIGFKKVQYEFCNKEEESINSIIAELEAFENRDKMMKQFNFFSDNPDDIDMQKMWKLLKNICHKQRSILPAAKKNHRG